MVDDRSSLGKTISDVKDFFSVIMGIRFSKLPLSEIKGDPNIHVVTFHIRRKS